MANNIQKVKKQTSNSKTRDANKVLYEAISQENSQVFTNIETQPQEKRSLLTVNISNLMLLALVDQITMMFYRTAMYGKIYVNSK